MKQKHHSLNCRGRLLDLTEPLVMGIINVTPDSFYDGGKHAHFEDAMRQAEHMIAQGVDIIDIGGASSKPKSDIIPIDVELQRVLPVIEAIIKTHPGTIISIDTWRAEVAQRAVEAGASIVNDVSAGNMDEAMMETVAHVKVPYIMMHMQGTPQTMQINPTYQDVVAEIADFFVKKIHDARQAGIVDLVIDLGFGFGKTIAHNYTLLRNMRDFGVLFDLPILAGMSRKSMIWKPLGIKPEMALNGTTALNMVALLNGANILRVHDVKEAQETIRLWQLLHRD